MSHAPVPPENTMPPAATPSTAPLSAEARQLLAELNGQPTEEDIRAQQAEAAQQAAAAKQAAAARQAAAQDKARRQATQPILLAPHADSHAAAFADLLDHIEDSDGSLVADEKAALSAALKYRARQRSEPAAMEPVIDEQAPDAKADMPPAMAGDGDTVVPNMAAPDMAEPTDAEIMEMAAAVDPEMAAEMAELMEAENEAVDPDALLEGVEDLLGEEPPAKGLKGLLARFSGGGKVSRLVGFKNASAAYNAQSGRSLLPFTIVRAVVLVLVAAVPPLVNLIVIQPQISDNNRKLTEIRTYKAKSQEDSREADKLAKKIARAQNAARAAIDKMVPDDEVRVLITQYLEALQRYDVELTGYNVTTDPDRKVVAGTKVQTATILEVSLTGRYDVYTEIRKVFVEQAKNVQVLSEEFLARPDTLELDITARFMMPTFRAYDSEIDSPEAIEARRKQKEKEEAERKKKAEEAAAAAKAAADGNDGAAAGADAAATEAAK